METLRIPVAEGVALAADVWAPAAAPAAPAFVLVHGLASNARLWDGVAAALAAAGHPAVTVDLRGHGRSDRPDGPYDVPTVAADLAALVEALRLDRPVVAGQSWGGNVVLELAAARPGLVRGLALVDGGWFEPASRFPSWEACRDALAPPRLAGTPRADLERRIRERHPDWPETGIAGVLANFETRPDGTVMPWLTYERHLAVLRGMWEHRPSARYARVTCPVLLAPASGGPGGRRSEEVERAAAALPRSRVRWFTGDHDIHAQQPGELAGVLLDLVREGFLA